MQVTKQPPGYSRGRLTRADIIAAAAEVFGEKGYAQATLKDIVSAVGITKGAFYHHWDSKEDLAIELGSLMGADYQRIATPRIESARSAWERIEVLLAIASELGDKDSGWPYKKLWVSLSFCLPAEAKRLKERTEQGKSNRKRHRREHLTFDPLKREERHKDNNNYQNRKDDRSGNLTTGFYYYLLFPLAMVTNIT